MGHGQVVTVVNTIKIKRNKNNGQSGTLLLPQNTFFKGSFLLVIKSSVVLNSKG